MSSIVPRLVGELTVGHVAGIIAACVVILRFLCPAVITYVLAGLLRDTETASTWYQDFLYRTPPSVELANVMLQDRGRCRPSEIGMAVHLADRLDGQRRDCADTRQGGMQGLPADGTALRHHRCCDAPRFG